MFVPKPGGQCVNGHPVHARLSLFGAYPPVRTNQILRITYLLHQVTRQGSLWVEHRKRLLLSMRWGSGSAVLPAAVVGCAFLLLHAHRLQPSAPSIGCFGPSFGGATMASANFSNSSPL